ncbi:thioredoxin family protein [Spirosoma radiotolerans]|uniref:thioredoxin family protein n=1 Tax=Spirosoma radiotolerans TaxID=1379870 RepID=UPI0006992515|nr:DUF255 domain-containing protein [Spirosoma radiotolerans]
MFLNVGALVRATAAPTDEPTGVTFFKGSWKEALAEAKRQNKPIFLDVFTSWCPPCKRMAKEAFPNAKVGAKFNVHFINYQLDAEKGEGIAIAKQYAVASYPTALYLTPDGGLIHRSVGYGGVNAMIDQADLVLAIPQLKITLAKGDKDFANGKRDPDFLKRYLKARQALHRPTADVLDAYLDALPESERTTPETLSFVADALQSSDTKAFSYLIKNRPSLSTSDLTKQSLARAILATTYRVLNNEFQQACATNDEALLEKVITNSERNTASANPFLVRQDAQKQEAANDYRLRFYRQTKNFVKYRAIAGPIAQNQLMSQSIDTLQRLDSITAIRMKSALVFLPDSLKKIIPIAPDNKPMTNRLISWKVAYSLHEIASTYLVMGASPTDWNPALTWAERAIALYRTPEYVTTYADLLKKLGRTEDALNVQK